jgi:hypothetical protein
MKPYTHFVIAAQLEEDILPELPEEYYWGAVAPDVRFIAGVRREETHLSPEKILGFLEKYPHLKSFIQGYLVHCLTDSVEPRALLNKKVILRPFLQHASIHFIATIIEAFYMENYPIQKPVSGKANEMLHDSGIRAEHLEKEVVLIKSYLEKPDMETNLAYVKSGANRGLLTHFKELESIQNNPLVKPFWFGLGDFHGLNQQIVSQVRGAEALKQICG